MSRVSRSRVPNSVFAVAAILLAAAPAAAQEVTEDQILKALLPPKTRSLSIGAPTTTPAPPSADAAFVDTLRSKTSATLTPDAREKLKLVAADKPAFDLSMEFDFRSDVLRGSALQNADKLGRVLSNPALANQTFVIAGHTDAKGTEAANQTLSERRAEAVKRYLVKQYKLPAANLIAVGYGKSRLKNEADPTAAENRRVQAVNLLQVKTANR